MLEFKTIFGKIWNFWRGWNYYRGKKTNQNQLHDFLNLLLPFFFIVFSSLIRQYDQFQTTEYYLNPSIQQHFEQFSLVSECFSVFLSCFFFFQISSTHIENTKSKKIDFICFCEFFKCINQLCRKKKKRKNSRKTKLGSGVSSIFSKDSLKCVRFKCLIVITCV